MMEGMCVCVGGGESCECGSRASLTESKTCHQRCSGSLLERQKAGVTHEEDRNHRTATFCPQSASGALGRCLAVTVPSDSK